MELHHIPSWFANVSFFFGSEFSVSLQTTSSGFPLLFFLFFGETVWVSTVENRFGKKSFKWQVLLKKDLTIEEYVGDWRKILPPEHYHSLHEGQRDSHTDFFHVTVPRIHNIFGLLKRYRRKINRDRKSRIHVWETNFIQKIYSSDEWVNLKPFVFGRCTLAYKWVENLISLTMYVQENRDRNWHFWTKITSKCPFSNLKSLRCASINLN